MNNSSENIESSKKTKFRYEFKLSLSLIHHFRSFQQDNHNFLPSFLALTNFFISDFKKKNQDFREICEYIVSFEPEMISLDLIIIAIHYFFGSIANMEIFLSMLKVPFTFPSLSKSHVNKTNIMTPLTIKNALKCFSYNQIPEQVNKIFFLNIIQYYCRL